MLVDRHPEEGVRREVGQIDSVEALRGVAVTLVVLFHYLVVRDPGAADPFITWVDAIDPVRIVLRNGYLGVDLFFLISGFLLVLPWARHALLGRGAPRARDFWIRRVRRIVPAYYVHLALLFLVVLPLVAGFGFWRENRWLVSFNAVAHSLFLHYTTPISSASLNLNGALWTLALEAQFYLLLPLIAPFAVRRPLACLVLTLLVSACWRWSAAHGMDGAVAFMMALGAQWDVPEAPIRHLLLTQLPGYLGHFGAGMAMGVAWLRWRPRHTWASVVAAAAAAAFLYWFYGRGGAAIVGPAGWLASLAAIAALFAAAVCAGGVIARWIANAALLSIGRASYSAYLYHVPLMLLWNRFHVLDGNALSLPAYLLVVGVVSWASNRFIERRFLSPRTQRARAGELLAAPIITR